MIISVILSIILFFILHFIYKKIQRKKIQEKLPIEYIFKVTVGDKTVKNPHYNDGPLQTFYINGEEAPILRLKINRCYAFQNLSDEPLYFTISNIGGYIEKDSGEIEEAPGSLSIDKYGQFKGLAKGTIYFKTFETMPVYFYYQSSKHKYMGNFIFLQ